MSKMKDGELLIFPTDTVYGLGCRLYDFKGLKNIYKVKQRDIGKQIPVLVYDLVTVSLLAKYTARDIKIMKKFWPGALTLIFKSSDTFYKKTNLETVAVRIPDNYIAMRLLSTYGPLWTTSCNISNNPPLNDKDEILETFKDKVDYIYIEENNNLSQNSSTILDLTGNEIKVVRQGNIKLEEILDYLKEESKL